MSPAVVDGQYLDVLVLTAPVDLFVLDTKVGKMNLVVEVRQVVFGGPGANLLLGPIRMAVVVVAVAVVLV